MRSIEGNPLDLLNNTLYQDRWSEEYGITEAYASITDVEKISIGSTEYYKLSFDADLIKIWFLDGVVYGDLFSSSKNFSYNSCFCWSYCILM